MDLAESSCYDRLFQLFDYRWCPITANYPILLADYNCTECLVKDKRLEIRNEMEVIFCSDTDCDKSFLTGFGEFYLYCKVAMESSMV